MDNQTKTEIQHQIDWHYESIKIYSQEIAQHYKEIMRLLRLLKEGEQTE